MLRVYRDQMASFSAAARAESSARVFRLLRRHFGEPPQTPRPGLWRSDEELRAIVAASLEKAAEHGVRRERDVFRLAVLMLVFGAEFDRTEPWAVELVAHTAGGAPELLADLLYERGIERVRPPQGADGEGEDDDGGR